jgi:hypothetical protein
MKKSLRASGEEKSAYIIEILEGSVYDKQEL